MKLVAAWIALLLQAVPSSSPLTQTPRASVEGIVTRVGSDEPIAGAQVTLTAVPGSAPRVTFPPVTTDNAGRFSIKDVDAGSYKLAVVRNGFARQEFGQRQMAAPGAPIVLTAGEVVKNIAVRLTPAGNVNGHVRSSTGRPVPGITVELVRRLYDSSGRQTFRDMSSARTDDRGEYRFYWMTPGRYYVVAGSPSFGFIFRESNENEVTDPYPYTFFPGTTEFEKAIAIDVRPGAEVDGVDFAMTKAQQYRIRARVVDPVTGQAPRQAVGSMSYWNPRGGGAVGGGGAYNAQTGTIEFVRLTPGPYSISVTAYEGPGIPNATFNRSAPGPSAGASVIVSNSDVDLGILRLEPPNVITGHVDIDGPPLDAPARENLQISLLTPADSPASPFDPLERTIQAFPRPDGSVTANFPYTSARVTAFYLPSGYYLREARLDGADALASPVRVSRSSKLEIVLSSKGGQIEGVIRDERLQPVAGVAAVLIPDVARHRTELFKQAISDQNGRFNISDIAPGDYQVFAWEALEPYAYFDPAILQKYDQKGRAVHIVESARESLEVRVIPAGVE